MEPIASNTLSKTCGEVISSNCVTWGGPAVPGTCGVPTLTQVVTAISDTATAAAACCTNSSPKVDCCTGTFPPGNVSGYTGEWVDFSASIPASGGLPGQYAWSISGMGTPFNAGGGTGNENRPQYKWTSDGDLLIRGSFIFAINPSIAQGTIAPIALASIPVINFPSGFTASQSKIVATVASSGYITSGPYLIQVTRGFLTIDYPSGILYFNYSFVDTTKTNITESIFMGGTTFNLA